VPIADRGMAFSPDELFRASFNVSTNLMAVTRVSDGRHYDVNPAWLNAFGYTRDEAVGKTANELGVWHVPEQRQIILDILKRDGIVRDSQVTMRAKDGALHECLVTMIPLKVSDEEYLLFSAYDVSTLKTLQDGARQADRRHQIANRQAKIAFWRWSLAESRMTDWSEVHSLFNPGRGSAPTTFDDMLAYLHPDDRERVLQAYLEANTHITGYDIEFRVVDSAGETRWLRGYAEVEYDENGVAVAQTGFDQDITEIKQAQETLQDEARRAERRHQIASHQAKIAFWRWSFQEDRLTDWSDAHGILNPSRSEIPDTYDVMLAHVHPDDRGWVKQAYLESDEARAGFDIEYRVFDDDGEIHWVREYAEVEYNEDGVAVGQSGFDQDITEIKQAQETLLLAHDDLEKRVQDRTRELNIEVEQRQGVTRLLRESQAQYAHAERIANIHHWTADAAMEEWISCSSNTEHVLKIPVDQLIGPLSTFFSYVHAEDRKRVADVYTNAVENACSYDVEYRLCPPGHEILYMRDSGEPVFNEDGTLILFRGTAQDITSRVERDEKLRRAAIMVQQAAKMAGLGHWFWDEIEDRCISCSDEVPAMYGLTMNEYIASKTSSGAKINCIHLGDRERVREIYTQSTAKGKDYEVEYRVIHSDESIHWLRETGAIYETLNGRVSSTIGTILDITRDKLAQQALKESESRNRAIVETAADGIVTIDEQGTIATFNRAAERIFDYQRSEVIGKNVEYLMPEPYASNHDEYLKNYLKTGDAKIIGIGREVEGLRSDGTTFPMLLAVSEIDATGKRIFTGIIRDISDYKDVETRAIAAKEEAERANAAKSEFMAHMSHEFRTPLNAIIGFSETMSEQVFGNLGHPKHAEYVGDIMRSGQLLLHIVNDILDISKVEAGQMTLYEDRFLPADVIQESIATIRGFSTEAREMTIDLNDEAPSFTLLADAGIFKQIMLNLLSNAVKFTPADGRIMVIITKGEDGELIVQVRDTGSGIAKEDLVVVLEPFGQARSGSQTAHKGTGLGLSLSKILTELHGGTLTIESELDKGTSITLRFPANRSVEAPGS